MRAFVLVVLVAFVNATMAAAAAQPLIPMTTDLPSAITSQLPNLGSPALATLPMSEQYQIGYAEAVHLRQQHQLLEDPEVDEYLNWIGKRLASQSTMGGANFHYLCVDTPVINADSVPGGYVFINSGLVLFTDSESELAAVMAHETAHDTQMHIARELINQEHANVESIATMLAAILLGAAGGGGGDAIMGGMMASQGIAAQEEIDYSRSVEEEADRVGMTYLAAAGFDPVAMADIFQKMMNMQGIQDSWVPAVLIDHPIDSERVADARDRAAQYPPVPDTSSPDYYLIKARLRVLTASGDQDIQKQFAQKIAKGNHSLGTMYGDALALMQDNKAARAVPILESLIREHGDLHLLYSALGQAQAQAGEMKQALATFRQAERLFPDNVPVTVRYAQALMADGKNAKAHALLLHLFDNVPPTPDQIALTARAASAAGDLADAYDYMGQYQLAYGNLPLAVRQFQLALAAPHLNRVQRERISEELKEVRNYLASNRHQRTSE